MNTKMPTRLNIVVVDLGFLKRNMELPTIEEKTTHSAYLEATLMEISKLMQFFEKRQFSIWKPYLVIGSNVTNLKIIRPLDPLKLTKDACQTFLKASNCEIRHFASSKLFLLNAVSKVLSLSPPAVASMEISIFFHSCLSTIQNDSIEIEKSLLSYIDSYCRIFVRMYLTPLSQDEELSHQQMSSEEQSTRIKIEYSIISRHVLFFEEEFREIKSLLMPAHLIYLEFSSNFSIRCRIFIEAYPLSTNSITLLQQIKELVIFSSVPTSEIHPAFLEGDPIALLPTQFLTEIFGSLESYENNRSCFRGLFISASKHSRVLIGELVLSRSRLFVCVIGPSIDDMRRGDEVVTMQVLQSRETMINCSLLAMSNSSVATKLQTEMSAYFDNRFFDKEDSSFHLNPIAMSVKK